MSTAERLRPGLPEVWDPAIIRTEIRKAAVLLINNVGPEHATLEALGAATQLSTAEVANEFASRAAVHRAIAESVIESHLMSIGNTLQRRRSLTESMQTLLAASWDHIETHLDEHRALVAITQWHLGENRTDGGNASMFELYVGAVVNLLTEIEQIHQISWELPVRQLARMLLATMDGLVLDYLSNSDSEGIREILLIVGFQFAQHGRRSAKNQRH